MKVAVHNEGVWKPSKYQGENKRVTFIPLEDHSNKYVYLNITKHENYGSSGQTVQQAWEKFCKKGNVLNVALTNPNTINKFGQFAIVEIKQVNQS